jgi:hypothetical protein
LATTASRILEAAHLARGFIELSCGVDASSTLSAFALGLLGYPPGAMRHEQPFVAALLENI